MASWNGEEEFEVQSTRLGLEFAGKKKRQRPPCTNGCQLPRLSYHREGSRLCISALVFFCYYYFLFAISTMTSTNTIEEDEISTTTQPPSSSATTTTTTPSNHATKTTMNAASSTTSSQKAFGTAAAAASKPFYPPRSTEKGQRISPTVVLGDPLGKGAFGVVYEAKNTLTGEVYAVKRVALRNLSPDQQKGFEQEVALLKVLNHTNIVKYIGFVKTRHHANVVLEYVEGGSLADNLKKFGNFSPPLVALYTRQVLKGCAYLHQQGVIHRDIKGANILCDKTGRVKLADFGVAVWVGFFKGERERRRRLFGQGGGGD